MLKEITREELSNIGSVSRNFILEDFQLERYPDCELFFIFCDEDKIYERNVDLTIIGGDMINHDLFHVTYERGKQIEHLKKELLNIYKVVD